MAKWNLIFRSVQELKKHKINMDISQCIRLGNHLIPYYLDKIAFLHFTSTSELLEITSQTSETSDLI